jgi:hypothetical protein
MQTDDKTNWKINKERGLFLNGFIALVPSRSFAVSENKAGHPTWSGAPGFGLVLGSALGLLPSIALSSAQVDVIVTSEIRCLLGTEFRA